MTKSVLLEAQLRQARRRGAHDASIGRPHHQADVCDWADLLEPLVTDETPFSETDALQHKLGQAYEKGYRESMRELTRTPNKTQVQWKILYRAGWADFDGDTYTLNDIGLAGGWQRYQQEAKQMRRDGVGPL